jgi:hypothetical protein
MERSLLRQMLAQSADDILHELTIRQHLNPHRGVSQVLSDAISGLGVCDLAAGRALEWLQIEPSMSIGRLRRAQLIQLSRCTHRFWRQGDDVDGLGVTESSRQRSLNGGASRPDLA